MQTAIGLAMLKANTEFERKKKMTQMERIFNSVHSVTGKEAKFHVERLKVDPKIVNRYLRVMEDAGMVKYEAGWRTLIPAYDAVAFRGAMAEYTRGWREAKKARREAKKTPQVAASEDKPTAQPKVQTFNIEVLTIGEARKLYEQLRPLFERKP